mgnify:CR=1 FL=1
MAQLLVGDHSDDGNDNALGNIEGNGAEQNVGSQAVNGGALQAEMMASMGMMFEKKGISR